MRLDDYKEMMDKVIMSDEMEKKIKKTIFLNDPNTYKSSRFSKNKRKAFAAMGTVAALLACIMVLGFENSAFAMKISLIGHIFEYVQNDFEYGGDYSEVGTKLPQNEEGKYKKTEDGVTISLSEVYCNSQDLYLTMEIYSEEVVPDIEGLQLFTEEKYSFNNNIQFDIVSLEGRRIDEHTYAGLVRFNLNNKREERKLPSNFDLKLKVNKIKGLLCNHIIKDESKEEDEYVIFNGIWEFSINVDVNTKDTITVDLKDRAENGVGFSKIVKDKYEMTVHSLNNDSLDFGEYFPIVLDANGRILHCGDSIYTLAINGVDVSFVELFLFDEDEWLNDIKIDYWKTSEGLTDPKELKEFRELMLERCVYYTKVDFEK